MELIWRKHQVQIKKKLNDNTIEHIWIEIVDKKDRLLLIKTLYQPNSDPRVLVLWTEKLEEILATMTKSFGETIILTGDTDIDIKKEY